MLLMGMTIIEFEKPFLQLNLGLSAIFWTIVLEYSSYELIIGVGMEFGEIKFCIIAKISDDIRADAL